MSNVNGTPAASSSRQSGGSGRRWAGALAILSLAFAASCQPAVLPDPTLPSLPPGRPQDIAQELDARIAGWAAMTVASVDTETGAVTLVPAKEDTPRVAIRIVAPLLDVQAVLIDRARHVAYEESLVTVGRWRE